MPVPHAPLCRNQSLSDGGLEQLAVYHYALSEEQAQALASVGLRFLAEYDFDSLVS